MWCLGEADCFVHISYDALLDSATSFPKLVESTCMCRSVAMVVGSGVAWGAKWRPQVLCEAPVMPHQPLRPPFGIEIGCKVMA